MKELDKYLGNWGRYQTCTFALLFVCGLNCGIQVVVYSFTLATPNVRCKLRINDTDYGASKQAEWESYYYTPSADKDTVGAYCRYCHHQNCTESESHQCDSGYLFDRSQYHTSMAIDYEMVCAEGSWKSELSKSLFMVGFLIGGAVFGLLADKIGRKSTLIISAILSIFSTNLTPLITRFEVFCVVQVLNGAFIYGPFLCGFIILMEVANGAPRTVAGLLFEIYTSIGVMLVGMVAYFVRDWKTLMWICSATSILYLPMIFFLDESFRWLAVTGKESRAVKNFQKIATINSISITDDLVATEMRLQRKENEDTRSKSESVLDLFRNGYNLARTTLIVFFTWLAVSMCYYGLSLNASDLPGNVYVNFIALAAMEVPGYVFSIPIMEKLGRKNSLVLTMGIGGITLIVSGVLPKSYSLAVTIMALIGKMFVTGAFGIIYVYSAEVFPTVCRNSACGFSSACARIGSMAAPQIHLIGIYTKPWLPVVIYGCFAFLGALLNTVLPETKNKPLPNSIQDAIEFSKKDIAASEDSAAMYSKMATKMTYDSTKV